MDDDGRGALLRNRTRTAGLVAGVLVLSHAWLSDPEQRAGYQYVFTITLGYGHLIGGLVFARARLAQLRVPGVPPPLLGAFAVVSTLMLFVAYTWVLHREPWIFAVLLGVSVWHIVENDVALGRAYANGLRLGPLSRSPDDHALALGLSAAVVLLGMATPSWRSFQAGELPELAPGLLEGPRLVCAAAGAYLLGRHRLRPRGLLGSACLVAGLLGGGPIRGWIALPDLFVATTLYHLVSWLLFFSDRARSLAREGQAERARRMRRHLLRVHTPPALLCTALLCAPAQALEGLRSAVFSPSIYLFWSAAHVLQTLAVRGLTPRDDVHPCSRSR